MGMLPPVYASAILQCDMFTETSRQSSSEVCAGDDLLEFDVNFDDMCCSQGVDTAERFLLGHLHLWFLLE